LPNTRRHRLPSSTLISFLFPVSLSFTALYRARVRPARHFSFCPYFSTPLFFFHFDLFPFSAEQRYQLPPVVFSYETPQDSAQEQGLQRSELATGAKYDDFIYHTACWRGQQHEQESKECLCLGHASHMQLFPFYVLGGGIMC
jgi:hypothetical protein